MCVEYIIMIASAQLFPEHGLNLVFLAVFDSSIVDEYIAFSFVLGHQISACQHKTCNLHSHLVNIQYIHT